MAHINNDIRCCGIREIVNICYNNEDSKQILLEVCEDRYDDGDFDHEGNCAFYIFSDTNEGTQFQHGLSLAEYIKENKLGDVITTKIKVSPNSGNQLKVWVWAVANSALYRWAQKQ